MNLDRFLEKVNKEQIDINNEYKFDLSISYYIKTITLVISLIVLLSYNLNMENIKKPLVIILLTLIFIYLFYHIYTLISYKIIVKDNEIIAQKNVKINLKNIKSLKLLPLAKIGVSLKKDCLEIIDNDDKRYILRLDIHNPHIFVALVSQISKVKVVL